jgi:cell division protein FtsW
VINKSHLLKPKDFLKYDWQLIVIVVLLCAGGLAFLASSLNTNPNNYWNELLRQFGVGIVGGVAVAALLARTDYHKLIENRKKLIFVTLCLLVFLGIFATPVFFLSSTDAKVSFISRFSWLPIKPHLVNGAVRWLDMPLGLPNLQPSEVAKITILIFFAGILAKYHRVGYSWQNLKQSLWLLGSISLLIFLQKDLGNIIIILIITFSAMIVANVPKQILVRLCVFSIICAALSIVSTPYRLQRFAIYANLFGAKSDSKNPEEDRQQVVNIQYAMQNGGWFGKGYGNSEWKQAGHIYEANTDSIIAIIGEEIGFVGTVAFLSLYVWLFYRGMKIAQDAVDLEGKVLATGIVVWIFAQVFLNISGMTGLIPMKGLPLPFVSQGGTALVMNLIGIGILLNISSQKRTELRREKHLAF